MPTTRSQAPLSIVRKIEEMIVDGSLANGQKLPAERQLAASLDVSRPSLREALSVLATLGLVRIEPGRGTFVAGGDQASDAPQHRWRFSSRYTLQEVYQFRFITESYAARRAAMVAKDSDFQKLREILEAYKAAIRTLDVEASVRSDFALHQHVMRMADNRILEDAHSIYWPIMLDSQRLPAARQDRLWEAAIEHERVVEAIAMRDPDGASYLMRLHITRAADRAGVTLIQAV